MKVWRGLAGWTSAILGFVVLGLWAYILMARGYEVDAAGTVGYSLATDYLMFVLGFLLIAAPIFIWIRGGLRLQREEKK